MNIFFARITLRSSRRDVTEFARNRSASLQQAFDTCIQIARAHYENFPVASLFLPANLRPYVAAVYAFARTADDFADEGELTDAERLHALDDWQKKLDACYEGRADHPIFIALQEVIHQKKIPKQLLSDLLTAFIMDVTVHRYRTFEDLLEYCRHSANPVGRLVLYLFDDASERTFELSDNICTALQLANFWQDVGLDVGKGRIYIPLEDMERFGYTESGLDQRVASAEFKALMKYEVERTKELFEKGRPLLALARRELRFELTLTWNGGMTILRKIENAAYDVFARRPRLNLLDKLSLFGRSVFYRIP
jgi:squalene synthase HpnC